MKLPTLIFFGLISISCIAQQAAAPQGIKEFESLIKHYRYLNPDSATYFANKAIEFARGHGDSTGVATILLQQGMIDDNDG